MDGSPEGLRMVRPAAGRTRRPVLPLRQKHVQSFGPPGEAAREPVVEQRSLLAGIDVSGDRRDLHPLPSDPPPAWRAGSEGPDEFVAPLPGLAPVPSRPRAPGAAGSRSPPRRPMPACPSPSSPMAGFVPRPRHRLPVGPDAPAAAAIGLFAGQVRSGPAPSPTSAPARSSRQSSASAGSPSSPARANGRHHPAPDAHRSTSTPTSPGCRSTASPTGGTPTRSGVARPRGAAATTSRAAVFAGPSAASSPGFPTSQISIAAGSPPSSASPGSIGTAASCTVGARAGEAAPPSAARCTRKPHRPLPDPRRPRAQPAPRRRGTSRQARPHRLHAQALHRARQQLPLRRPSPNARSPTRSLGSRQYGCQRRGGHRRCRSAPGSQGRNGSRLPPGTGHRSGSGEAAVATPVVPRPRVVVSGPARVAALPDRPPTCRWSEPPWPALPASRPRAGTSLARRPGGSGVGTCRRGRAGRHDHRRSDAVVRRPGGNAAGAFELRPEGTSAALPDRPRERPARRPMPYLRGRRAVVCRSNAEAAPDPNRRWPCGGRSDRTPPPPPGAASPRRRRLPARPRPAWAAEATIRHRLTDLAIFRTGSAERRGPIWGGPAAEASGSAVVSAGTAKEGRTTVRRSLENRRSSRRMSRSGKSPSRRRDGRRPEPALPDHRRCSPARVRWRSCAQCTR